MPNPSRSVVEPKIEYNVWKWWVEKVTVPLLVALIAVTGLIGLRSFVEGFRPEPSIAQTTSTDTPEPTSTLTPTPTVAPAVVTIESRICVNNDVSNTIWMSDETYIPVQEKSGDAEGKLLSILSVDGNPLKAQGLILRRWDRTFCHLGVTSQTLKELRLEPDVKIKEQLDRPNHTFEVSVNPTP